MPGTALMYLQLVNPNKRSEMQIFPPFYTWRNGGIKWLYYLPIGQPSEGILVFEPKSV